LHHQIHSQQLPQVHVAAGMQATLTLLLSPVAGILCELCVCVQGHSMRLAFSGGDAKHFYVDHLGIKTMWVHTGPGRQSAIHIYVTNQ